jgi:hypothetical protein
MAPADDHNYFAWWTDDDSLVLMTYVDGHFWYAELPSRTKKRIDFLRNPRITVPMAAAAFDVTRGAVYKWIRRGDLRARVFTRAGDDNQMVLLSDLRSFARDCGIATDLAE